MIIKSSETMCRDYQAISILARSTKEPVYITYRGEGDLVILSMDAYEKMSRPPVLLTPLVKEKAERVSPVMERNDRDISEAELGAILRDMYERAPKGDLVAFIHLFAIKYAQVLAYRRIDKKAILHYAGLPVSYQTELAKGMKLSQYVMLKPEEE